MDIINLWLIFCAFPFFSPLKTKNMLYYIYSQFHKTLPKSGVKRDN